MENYQLVEVSMDQLDEVAQLFDMYMQFYGKDSNQVLYKEYIRERLQNNEATIFLAMNDQNRAMGFVLNYYSFSSVSLGKIIVLNDLFIHPEYRKRGVAERLIRETFQLAKNNNAIRVDLGTGIDNTTAQKLYERIGFVRDTDFYAYSYAIE